jgi:hypothetical protein
MVCVDPQQVIHQRTHECVCGGGCWGRQDGNWAGAVTFYTRAIQALQRLEKPTTFAAFARDRKKQVGPSETRVCERVRVCSGTASATRQRHHAAAHCHGCEPHSAIPHHYHYPTTPSDHTTPASHRHHVSP